MVRKENAAYVHTDSGTARKKGGVVPLEMTWRDLESIILSEISQTEKDEYYRIPLINGI